MSNVIILTWPIVFIQLGKAMESNSENLGMLLIGTVVLVAAGIIEQHLKCKGK